MDWREELIESIVNGNISWFKNEVRKLSKKKLINLIAWMMEYGWMDYFRHIEKAFEIDRGGYMIRH